MLTPLSLIVPIFNEESLLEASVLQVLEFAEQQKLNVEILLVSNGSTDQSVEIAKRLQKKDSRVRSFSIPQKSVGQAFALGVREAQYEHVVSLDADISVDLMFIVHAAKLLPYAAAIVGSKSLGQQKRSWIRVLGSQAYLVFTQVLFGFTYTDYSMSAKAFKRSELLPMLAQLDDWTGYVLEIVTYLHVQKKQIIQIGVNCEDNRGSKFNLFHEGLYRYQHLYRVWRLIKNKKSWLYL